MLESDQANVDTWVDDGVHSKKRYNENNNTYN